MKNELTLKDLVRERHDEDDKDEHEEMDMGPVKELLEDDMPELDGGPVGRVRLIGALMRKFGKGFKGVPAALKALDHYDKESAMMTIMKRNRSLHG